jgi:hypothetical protein
VDGAERFDHVESVQPVAESFALRFAKVLVDVVVDDISGNDQPEVWNVQDGRGVRVGMTDLHCDELVFFEEEMMIGGGRGRNGCIRGLAVARRRTSDLRDRGWGRQRSHDCSWRWLRCMWGVS